jgi:DNA-binding NarL/FixJ family response regulator
VAAAVEQPFVLADARDDAAGSRTAVLLDPHPLWLEALERVLARIGVQVLAKRGSARDALAELEEHEPDLFVTEIAPTEDGIHGLAWLRRALQRAPRTKVIVLSRHADSEIIDAALEAGALAYVVKTAHPDDLVSTVRQVFAHSVYLGPVGVAEPDPATAEALQSLTPRELEILQLLAEGHSNAQLARMLWVTEQTVKFHLSNIYRKLGVANRVEAARVAVAA